MEQRLYLEQSQKQVQRMILTPRMQQAIKMLQMPTIELEALVEQELAENPCLETLSGDEVESPDQIEGGASPETENAPSEGSDWDMAEEPEQKSAGEELSEGKIELSEDWERFFEDTSDLPYVAPSGFSGGDEEEYDRIIPDEMTLREELERQLHLSLSGELELEIGSAIINSLDEDGYLTYSVEELADQNGTTPEIVEKVLAVVHTLEPAGIGARSLAECLEIQYRQSEMNDPLLLDLIRHHLEDLEHKRFQVIARALKITPQEVQELADSLAHFEPRPGRRLTAYENEYLKPDVFVEKIDGEWQVRINDDGVPPLRVSHRYRTMFENRDQLDKQTVDYLRTRLHSAVDLVRNIEQRKVTLYRVTQEIVNQQKDFLENGVTQLRPMRLRDVADAIGVHETTVCRVVNGKYVDTPQGLYELKYFFSTGLESDGGDDTSSKSVMAMIQEIVDQEPPKKPLSDQKISDILKSRGINVARRTVAKYRDILGILPTSMRKRV